MEVIGKMTQSKLHSFFESLNAASVAAPTAIGLHKLMLIIFGDCTLATAECNDIFVLISWVVFFIHSIIWKFIIRRIFEKYGVQLDPIHLIRRFRR